MDVYLSVVIKDFSHSHLHEDALKDMETALHETLLAHDYALSAVEIIATIFPKA